MFGCSGGLPCVSSGFTRFFTNSTLVCQSVFLQGIVVAQWIQLQSTAYSPSCTVPESGPHCLYSHGGRLSVRTDLPKGVSDGCSTPHPAYAICDGVKLPIVIQQATSTQMKKSRKRIPNLWKDQNWGQKISMKRTKKTKRRVHMMMHAPLLRSAQVCMFHSTQKRSCAPVTYACHNTHQGGSPPALTHK